MKAVNLTQLSFITKLIHNLNETHMLTTYSYQMIIYIKDVGAIVEVFMAIALDFPSVLSSKIYLKDYHEYASLIPDLQATLSLQYM